MAMAEYAMVTAAVALLAVTLVGAVGKTPAQLPRTTAAAIKLVSSNARAKKVSVAGARAAYTKAPYRKTALKYVYAVGWITGTHDRASCLYTASTADAVREATTEIRGNSKLLGKLRSRDVTPKQAATALVGGISYACS